MNKKTFAKLFAVVLMACVLFSLAIVVSLAADSTATISFATTDHRVSLNGDAQVWKNGGITFTNNKANSGTAIADYSNPVRIYADSSVTIEAPGNITSIVITSNGTAKYKTALENSVEGAGATYTVDGNVYTITPAVGTTTFGTSFTMTMTAQARFVSLTVNYEEAPIDPDNPTCEHTNKTTTTVDAKCTVDGSVTVTCDNCGETVSTETITAPGHTGGTATCEALAVCETCGEAYGRLANHNYADGTCTVCGDETPADVTITFDDISKRIEYDTSHQIWVENGITFTNNKGSGSNVGDYFNPVRLYKNSEIIVTGSANITKIVFNANTAAYATALGSSITGATATVNETAVTVIIGGTTNTFTAVLSEGTARLDSITVYYGEAVECEHANKDTVTVDATCRTDGSITVNCADCGFPVSGETIPAAHDMTDGICSVCGLVEAPKTGVPYKFGMYQGNKKDTYYLNGSMNGFYMETVTDAAAGINVYLQQTEGGYYLYTFVDGVKTYINIVVNGDYKNAVYEATATTVYTIDASKNTVCTTIDADTLYFGTSNSGTYTTVGTTFSSGFVCQFYAAGDVAKFNSASVVLGTDLGMIFKANVPAGVPTVTIEFAGKTYEIAAETLTETTYEFTFKGIGPHQMAENIKATLYVDGVAVAEVDNYSVEENLKSILAQDATLADIVNAVLVYGNEAENYNGIEGGVDASEIEVTTDAIDAANNKLSLENAEEFGFSAAGVNFDYVNKIYVKFYVEGEFKFYVNGTEVEIEKTEDGNYKFYTGALTAKQFNDEYKFEIEVDGARATLVYSVNSYAYAMQDDAEMGALAKALYAYGYSAENYN